MPKMILLSVFNIYPMMHDLSRSVNLHFILRLHEIEAHLCSKAERPGRPTI